MLLEAEAAPVEEAAIRVGAQRRAVRQGEGDRRHSTSRARWRPGATRRCFRGFWCK